MESSGEGGGGGGGGGERMLRLIEIETAAERLERREVFHIVKEIVGFVLFMHHQIPSVLQQLENEFGSLKEEYRVLEEAAVEPNKSMASYQRNHNSRKREIKQGIKRLEKLMSTISSLLCALQLALDEMPSIQGVSLVLGTSLMRPQHVYQLGFSQGKFGVGCANVCTKTRVAEGLARKAIRSLISAGAGSSSYTGPCKLFLLVKSSHNFYLPLHFLPKRDFHFSKKVVPFNLYIKCKSQDQASDGSQYTSLTADSTSPSDSTVNDAIWFQCRHIIKGLGCKTTIEC